MSYFTCKCQFCGKNYSLSLEMQGKKAKCSGCGNIFTLQREEQKKVNTIEVFQPNKVSFLSLHFLFLFLFFALSSGYFFYFLENIYYFGYGSLIFGVLAIFDAIVALKKQKYIFGEDTIICYFGGIFQSDVLELEYKNISQVIHKSGFFQRLFFQTGDIILKTGSSMGNKIRFQHLKDSLGLYEKIQQKMKNHGYRLQKDKVVMQTTPYFLGYILEIIKFVILRVISSFFLLISFLTIIQQNGIFQELSHEFGDISLEMIGSIVIGFIGVIFFFAYCDYRLRKYTLYNDSVEYFEGFLNKTTSIIPMESITTVEKNQSFISKIFGIYNVIITSEGFGNKVVFANITNGNKLSILVNEIKKNNCFMKKNSLFDYEKNLDFTQEYQVNSYKTYINNLWAFGIIPLYVYLFFKSKSFVYKITTHTIELHYDFINAYNKIFHLDTITRVTFHRSFIDTILGTCSVKFYSLGDYQPITFNNIFYFDNLESDILSKIGINSQQEGHNLPLDVSKKSFFYRYILFSLPILFFVGLFFFFLILDIFSFYFMEFIMLMIGLGVIYLIFFACYKFYFLCFSKKFYFHTLYDKFILSARGIIFQKRDYFIFDHIKSLSSLIYPRVGTGTLIFELSGGLMMESQRYKFLKWKYQNKIKIPYVKSLENVMHILENKLHKDPIQTEVIDIVTPGIFPYLILYIGFIIGFVSLTPWSNYVLFFLLFVGGMTFYIRYKTHYILEKNRFMKKSGILYKKKKTILFKKLDYVHCYRNFLNFLTKNANIFIFTKGSGYADLKFSFIEKYGIFYNNTKKMN